MSEITPGFYRHFEGSLYRVSAVGHLMIGAVTVELPGEPVVVCSAQHKTANGEAGHTQIWPANDFTANIAAGSRSVPRFTPIPMPEIPSGSDVIATPLFADADRSIAFIAIGGVNHRTVNHGSSTTYEVLKGQGIMDIGGAVYALQEGAVVTAPRNVPYHDEGAMVLLATSTPPFNPDDVEEWW